MNHKTWATTFAFMLLAETAFLAHDHAEVEQLRLVAASKSPTEEHCVAALATCNFVNETRRKK